MGNFRSPFIKGKTHILTNIYAVFNIDTESLKNVNVLFEKINFRSE